LSDPRTSANLASVTRHGNETSRMCSLMQVRRLLFPGGIPGHSFLRSATQCPTANLSCAVAFDDHTIKKAPIIRTILAMEGLPPPIAKYPAAKNLSASRLFEIELNQNGRQNLEIARTRLWKGRKFCEGPPIGGTAEFRTTPAGQEESLTRPKEGKRSGQAR
jgi:hypothetical protein